jgi:Fe2+ transport system protein FeoA
MKNILSMFSNKKEIEWLKQENIRLKQENINLMNKLINLGFVDTSEFTTKPSVFEQGIEFVNKCSEIHNARYDYSLVNYINTSTNVKILCPIHGEFEQRPSNHMQGKGCPKCGNVLKGRRGKKTYKTIGVTCTNFKMVDIGKTDKFIRIANKTHKNKYDYSLVNYMGANDKVKIICHIHGEFEQRPRNHTGGQGCPKCGTVARLLSMGINKRGGIDKNQQVLDLTFDNQEEIAMLEYKSKKPTNHDVLYSDEFINFLNTI